MEIKEYVSLAQYSSYRIGGPARYFVEPKTPAEIQVALLFARKQELPYYVLGSGTNILVSDSGVNGVVLKIGKDFAKIQLHEQEVTVGAGLPLNRLIYYLAEQNLGGFELLAGIPGSVGGAVVMNAGAFRVFIGDFIKEVSIITEAGKNKVLQKEQLELGYRTSIFQKNKDVIYRIRLHVKPKEPAEIKANIAKVLEKRKEHPQLPSCGSTFRNPPGIPAGQLIEQLGLKGARHGNAQISLEHGNFIVNLGGATAQDVYSLIRLMQEKASQRGFNLQPEVKLWGNFDTAGLAHPS
jgi:UDP-N-acetylmuramate dehydrogenase